MTTKAKESLRIQKARKKLQKKLHQEEKQLTPQALMRAMQVNRQQILRHTKERIDLKDKSIALFDANQHTAKVMSQHVRKLYSRLIERESAPRLADWRGRITKSSE